jgi:hypothetical protein
MSKNIQRRLDHLQEEHAELNKLIDKDTYASDLLVHTLKKKKLKLKDEIEQIKSKMLAKE